MRSVVVHIPVNLGKDQPL